MLLLVSRMSVGGPSQRVTIDSHIIINSTYYFYKLSKT